MFGKIMLIGLLVSPALLTGCASDKNKVMDKSSKLLFDATDYVLPGSRVIVGVGKAMSRVPMANIERDAQAKTFATNPDKANLYVYRNEADFGSALRFDLEIDGKQIGAIASSTFAVLEVDPGKHAVIGKAENDFTLEVAAQAGKNYFIWQEVKIGFISARNKLHLVDEEQGKEGVLECGLIAVAK